jgi:hypothetical protein
MPAAADGGYLCKMRAAMRRPGNAREFITIDHAIVARKVGCIKPDTFDGAATRSRMAMPECHARFNAF